MKLSYRPEIDGLRGISIILVILYHLKVSIKNQNLFEFGYLGVDIFFVISGYLIGRIILKKISEKNFNFKSFYESRARRLLPTLFCNTHVENKCSANTHQHFFFSDKYNPSKFSSKMINDLIIKKINETIIKN